MADVDMTDVSEEFQLSAVVKASEKDIRALVVTGSNEIIAGGRDETVRFFAKRRGQFEQYATIPPVGDCYVNAMAYLEQGEENLLFVGRKNGSVAVYRNGNTEPFVTHSVHKQNVCCLYVDKKNMKLLSGSWDATVVVWPIDKIASDNFSALLLTGHELSVWALASLENRPGYYLSGSADKTINLWEDDKIMRTYKGHTDVVRALLMLNDDSFISAANDNTIRLWHIEQASAIRVFKTMVEEFTYSLSRVGNFIVSSQEKGYIEVWRQRDAKGDVEIVHSHMAQIPASSAWTIAALSEKDLVVGASDGNLYFFSTDPSKKAPEDVVTAMNDLLAARVAAELERHEQEAQGEIVIKVALDDGAAKMELRYKKGSDPAIAAEKFIRDNDLPISYLNEITDYIVANIPEARQAVQKKYRKQQTQKVEVDGVRYDYAMEVNADGRPLKLAFNISDDPDAVAVHFCEKYQLPIKFAPKFAHLVKNEIQGKMSGATGEFADPFTGGGRYVPGGSDSLASGGFADPLTGGGRYVPQASTTSSGSASSGGDPLTSGGRYIPGSADSSFVPNACRQVDKLRPRGELVPLPEFCLFGAENVSQKAITRLKELNEKQESFKMADEQLAALERLMGSAPGSIDVGEMEVSALELGLQWAMEDLVVILDVFRLALLHEKLNEHFCNVKTRGGDTVLRLQAILVSDPADPVKIFVCRAVANAFAHPAGCRMLASVIGDLLPQIAACFNSQKGPLQLAAASALANWSLLLLRQSEKCTELGPREDFLRVLIKELEPVSSFGDKTEPALIRLLQAIVTLLWGDRQVISLAKQRSLTSIINRLKDAVVADSGKNIARDIVEMVFAV